VHCVVSHLSFKSPKGVQLELAGATASADAIRSSRGFQAFYIVELPHDEALLIRMYDTAADIGLALSEGRRPELGAEFRERPRRMSGEVIFALNSPTPAQE
jgi:hypothetical protein